MNERQIPFLSAFILLCMIIHFPLFAMGGHKIVVSSAAVVRRPHFFICTHDYEHSDLLVAREEIERIHSQTGVSSRMVLANKPWNRAFDALLNRNAKALYTTSGTTRRILCALAREHVFIFLYRSNTGTGIHHVLRQFDGPVHTVRITSRAPPVENHSPIASFKRGTGALFYVRYTEYRAARSHARLTPRDGMQSVKRQLYPHPPAGCCVTASAHVPRHVATAALTTP